MALKNVFAWLAGYAAALFVWVVNPGNMSGSTGIMNTPAVYEMWKFVRDFFNLFFILILLLSAFATVFQVENFSIRKIFLNILIAALIINFSFPITRFLIDLTNVPMYYFLNAILPGQPGGEGFVRVFLATTGLGALPMAADGAFTKAFFDVVFTFLLAVSLLVLGVMFTIRLIALTLLLIFSPFGFAAALMPGFQKLGQEWWGKFWSYAFFGPSAALVLLVAIRFMESVSVGGVYLNLKQTTTNMTAGSPEANSMATMLYYLIPIILIWTAIGMANRFSIAGASKVVGWGETFSRWTAKKAGKVVSAPVIGGTKLIARKAEKQMAQTKGLRWLSPTVLKTAWKARSEEQKHKDEAPVKQAAARVQDTLNKRISQVVRNPLKWRSGKGVEHTENTFAESQRQAHEAEKHITEVSDTSDHVINETIHGIDEKKLDQVNGGLLAAAKSNDLNDLIVRLGKDGRYNNLKDSNGNGLDKDAAGNLVVSSRNARLLIAQTLRDAGEKDEELLAKRVMTISDRATASGNFAFGGLTTYDADLNGGHGGFRLTRQKGEKYIDKNGQQQVQQDDEQGQWAAGKVKNLESQKRQTSIHPDSIFTRSESGFGDINGEVAKEIIGTFTGADVTQVERSRDDLKEAIHQAYMNQSTEFMKLFNSNDIFKQYVESVVMIKRGIDHKKRPADFATKHPPGSKWPPQNQPPTPTPAPAPANPAPPAAPNWTTSPGATPPTPTPAPAPTSPRTPTP